MPLLTGYSPLGEHLHLTDDQTAAGSRYTWDESAYQADTSDPKTAGWTLTTPE